MQDWLRPVSRFSFNVYLVSHYWTLYHPFKIKDYNSHSCYKLYKKFQIDLIRPTNLVCPRQGVINAHTSLT